MAIYFLLVPAAAAFAALCYYRPLWGLYLITALLPSYLIRFSFFGIPMTWLEAMILILAIVVLVTKKINFKKIRDDVFFWPIVGVIIAATIAVAVSPAKLSALGAWKAYFVEPIIFYWLMLSLITVRRQLEGIFWSLGLSVLYLAAVAIGQKPTGWGVPATYLDPRGFADRVVSLYSYPNAIGLYFGPILIVFLGFLGYKNQDSLLLYLSNSQRFWLKLLVIAFGSLAVVFAQSYGAIIAVIICTFVLLFTCKKTRLPALIILLIFAIIMVVVPVWRELIITKITASSYSGMIRRLIWGETWAMLRDHWLFGAGLAGYPAAIAAYHSPKFEIFPYPHNILFNFWSELGLPGLAAFAGLAAVFIWQNVTNIFKIIGTCVAELPFDKIASFVFLLIGLEVLIHGLVDVPYFKNDLSVLFWIIIGASSLNIKLRK